MKIPHDTVFCALTSARKGDIPMSTFPKTVESDIKRLEKEVSVKKTDMPSLSLQSPSQTKNLWEMKIRVCAYKPCSREFLPNVSCQVYCSRRCCELAMYERKKAKEQ